MRKVTYGGATSLDNFIAGPGGAIDWIRWGKEAGEVMKDYWKSIDTVVMGRKTFEVASRGGSGGGGYPGVTSYVCSRTLPPGERGGATVVADCVALVRELKAKPGRDICCMGGGELAQSLFEAGLIDEIGLNIHPVLLGSGVPLFLPMSRPVELELTECRAFKNGCAYVMYRVKHDR
jgi:dihydrofolate reductase